MNIKLSEKGWVVIPAVLRKKYKLVPGANLQVVDYGGVLAIVQAFKNPIREGAGMLKGGKPLTQVVVEEHRQDRERE